MYPYMNMGSYCAYYAVNCQTGQPMSMSTTCGLGTGNCGSPAAPNCVFFALYSAGEMDEEDADKDVGSEGYGRAGEKPIRNRAANHPGGAGPQGKMTPIDSFVIKFLGGKDDPDTDPDDRIPLYAQVFMQLVEPPQSGHPPAVLATAVEIQNPGVQHVRYDFTTGDTMAVTPAIGRDRAYVYHYGTWDIEIIAHWKTPAHGQ